MTARKHEWLVGTLFVLSLDAVIVLAAIALFFWTHAFARADDYSHSHEDAVGKFYQNWQIPSSGWNNGKRGGSCCNRTDCRPVVNMRRGGGGTQVQMQERDGSLSHWYTVPDDRWEDQQPDPRESPDGRSHACVRTGIVICAVRGGDI